MSPNQMKSMYKKGAGLIAIAEKSKESPGFVRKTLVAQRVKIRGKGRPAGQKKQTRK